MIYSKELICTIILAFYLVLLNFNYIDLFRQVNFKPTIANIDCMNALPLEGELILPINLMNKTRRLMLNKTAPFEKV